MKRFAMFLALAFAAATVSTGMAQDFGFGDSRQESSRQTPAAGPVDIDELEAMLGGLGHRPERFEVNGLVALRISLSHGHEERVHMVAIDTEARTIAIVGGGFAFAPKVERATTGWYRKWAHANNSLAPAHLFINDGNVLGLTTSFGNDRVSPELLKQKIDQHVKHFDEVLTPLAEELGQLSEALAEL